MSNFKTLKLINPIIRAFTEAGYSKPTDVQEKIIPLILEGKDLIALAPKRSGKIAAFVLPILQMLKKNYCDHKKTRVLIVVPNIEASLKVEENFRISSKYSSLSVMNIADKHSIHNRSCNLREGVDVLVITLDNLDKFSGNAIDLSKVEILICYDMDNTLKNNFLTFMNNILHLIPKKSQKLIIGSTIPDFVRKIHGNFQNTYIEIAANRSLKPLKNIQQSVYYVEIRDKADLLVNLFHNNLGKRMLVFTDTKYVANDLKNSLEKSGITAAAVYANRPQAEQQNNLDRFNNNTLNILVTTDIASKEIKIQDDVVVVQYDLPVIPETYLQRIDHPIHADHKRSSILFCTAHEHAGLRNIQNLIGFAIPVTTL